MSSESTVPSKQELLIYIEKHNILDNCPAEIRELFYLIEDSKNMVSLTKNSEPLLSYIKEKHNEHHKQLQTIIIYKLLKLLSQLYTKIKIDNFIRFLGSLDYAYCENIIHLASFSDFIKVRIDHKRRLLVFQDDVQDMQSLSLRFVNFSENLQEVIYSIENKKQEGKEQKMIKELREESRKYVDSARTALARRQKLIEDSKRIANTEQYVKPRQVEQRTENVSRTAPKLTADQVRLKEKLGKLETTMKAYEAARKEALTKQLRGIQGFKIDKKKFTEFNEDELDKLTLKQLEDAKTEWDEREKRKEEAAINNAFRKSDYLERARREEFVSVLKKEWEQTKDEKEELTKTHRENFDKMLEFKNKIQSAQKFRVRNDYTFIGLTDFLASLQPKD